MKLTIEDAILVDRDVCRALKMLRQRMAEFSISEGKELMESISADYKLMCDCFVRGMRDPQGGKVYDGLLRRTYRLYNVVRLASMVRKRATLSQCASAAKIFAEQDKPIKMTLEGYVQETAMATLLPEWQQAGAIKKANAVHQRYMDGLFCSIVVSGQWSDDTAASFLEIVLSPTIDQNDAIVIVSAMTLALLTVFDINKWLTLVNIYKTTAFEPLRQRSLTGFVLTLPEKESSFFPEVHDAIVGLKELNGIGRELLEMQMQIYYCARTEADSEEIKRDIMPTLIKNNNLGVTRNGIEEDDENSDDLLDPGAADKNIAELESKMDRMMNMQKSGSDIYFSGFSHMKRFSFFYQISNWFTPFYIDHPDVVNAIGGNDVELIRNVIEHGPFCDSDKYSFAFAFASVVNKLPAEVKEMMINGNGQLAVSEVDCSSAAYIRRMYLQDLYRFFMLYQGKKDFYNPLAFSKDGSVRYGGLFFANHVFDVLVEKEVGELSQFLFRKRQYEMVVRLLSERDKDALAYNERVLLGETYMRLGQYANAYNVYSHIAEGDNVQAMKGLADSLYMLRHYAEAADVYERLLVLDNKNKSYIIYHSLSLINDGKVKDGLADLFRLDYENPHDLNVKRAIAWGYLMGKKPHEAESVYERLVGEASHSDFDILNCGYAKWMLCKNAEAVSLFKQYAAKCPHSIADDFVDDSNMLDKYGILDYERKLMLDAVEDR